MEKHTRSAFSRIGEILQRSIDYISRIGAQLERARLRELPERVRMLLTRFEADQRKLLAAMELYVDDIPAGVSDTYVNFYSAFPEAVDGPEDPLTTLGLTSWLEELNQHLIDVFGELASTTASTEVRDAMTALANMVQAHDRRLSMDYQRGEDM